MAQQNPEDEIIDISLRQVLSVSLSKPTSENPFPERGYLRLLSSRLILDGEPLLLSEKNLEAALLTRISHSAPIEEGVIEYLKSCYQRSYNSESEAITRIQSEPLIPLIKGVLNYARKLILHYTRLIVAEPEYFLCISTHQTPPVESLLNLISFQEGIPEPGFLYDLFQGDESTVEAMMRALLDQLKSDLNRVSLDGAFERKLNALVKMQAYSQKTFAKALSEHPNWIPNKPVANFPKGRILECFSILGALLRISAIPDMPPFRGLHEVWHSSFENLNESELDKKFELLTEKAEVLQLLVHLTLYHLMNQNAATKVYEYIVRVITTNIGRDALEENSNKFASSGFFINLIGTLYFLLDACSIWDKIDELDPCYILSNNYVDFGDLQAVNATKDKIESIVANNETLTGEKTYSEVCHLFYMTARVMRLGLHKAILEHQKITGIGERTLDKLVKCEELIAQSSTAFLEDEREHLTDKYNLALQESYCYEVTLFSNRKLIQKIFRFYSIVMSWSMRQAGGVNMTLPDTCETNFSIIPRHFLDDAMDSLIVFSFRGAFNDIDSDITFDISINFILMFVASPSHIHDIDLRSKMVQVLNFLRENHSEDFASFEENHFFRDYLVRNLFKFFVDPDIHKYDSSLPEESRVNLFYHIAKILHHVWHLPAHEGQKHALGQVAIEEKKGLCVSFLHCSLKDIMIVLDNALDQIITSRRTGEVPGSPTLNNMKIVNKGMKVLLFMSEKIPSPFLLLEFVETIADKLYHILYRILGPQCEDLSVEVPSVKYNPTLLVSQVVTIYVRLARADTSGEFPLAVGMSFKEDSSDKLFHAAADFLLLQNKLSLDMRRDFLNLRTTAKAAAAERKKAEIILGDIPADFSCPITFQLMRDPVIVPTSIGKTSNRAAIERHLLRDKRDPYNRKPLTREMLVDDLACKKGIEFFLKLHNVSKTSLWPSA